MTEADFLHYFRAHLPLPPRSREGKLGLFPVCGEEFACGEGVADLVQGWLDADIMTSLTPEGWQVLQAITASRIFCRLRTDGSSSPQRLAQMTGTSQRTVQAYLGEMLAHGLVVAADDEVAVPRGGRFLPSTEIWAFELKLTDWRRALYQALRYKSFAHYAIVAMPTCYARRALAEKEAFCRFGIGLLSASEDDAPSFLIQPRRCRPRSPAIHLAAVARLWMAAAS